MANICTPVTAKNADVHVVKDITIPTVQTSAGNIVVGKFFHAQRNMSIASYDNEPLTQYWPKLKR